MGSESSPGAEIHVFAVLLPSEPRGLVGVVEFGKILGCIYSILVYLKIFSI